jgi:hypothetical protein
MLDPNTKDDGVGGIKRLLRSALLFLLVAGIVGVTFYVWREDVGHARQTVHEMLVYIGAAND